MESAEYSFKNAEGGTMKLRGKVDRAALESVRARGYDRVLSGGSWRPWTIDSLLPVEGK